MRKQLCSWIVGVTVGVFFLGFNYLKDSRVTYAQETGFLSPPYFGTTTVWNIFDHEYPNYNGRPPGEIDNMVHNNGQRLELPVHQGGPGNDYCVGYSGHDGIDYGLHYNYVRAAHAGMVIEAGWDNPNHQLDFGLHVRLETIYNGVTHQTVYGHLSSILVKNNESVIQGKIIAISGDTGNSTAPHLHFSVRRPENNGGTLYSANPYGWHGSDQDPWEQLDNRPPSVNLWQSYPSIEPYSSCEELPYPDGPEISAPTDPPLVPAITAPPYTTIIDNHNPSPRFEVVGPWTQYPCGGLPHCYGSSPTYTYHTSPQNSLTGVYATYTPGPGELIPGNYDVYAYTPDVLSNSNASLALYYIYHNNQVHYAGFDQQYFNKPTGQLPWAYLGRYDFAGGGVTTFPEMVRVSHEGNIGENLSADAVVFVLADGPANIIKDITLNSDDAGLEPGGCTYSSFNNEIYLGYCDLPITNPNPIISGFRFNNVNLPTGAVITKAHIQFRTEASSGPHSPLYLKIYGESSPNSLTFSDLNQPGSRPLTTSSVSWNVPQGVPWNVLFDTRYSPNLAPVAQEIVNIPGWSSALTFIVKPNPIFNPPSQSAGRSRRVMAYERNPDGTYDARLFIWLACSEPSCPTQ